MPATARPCVLYVEHRLVDLLLMQIVFRRRAGLELVVAQSGVQAVRHAPALRPHLLLIGLDLPDGHGAEWLRALRGCEGCADVPAVALTADGSSDAMQHGFAEVWSKPLDLRRVVARLDALLPAAAPAGRARAPFDTAELTGHAFWTPTQAGARAHDLPNPAAANAAGRQAFQAASFQHHAQE